MTTPRPEERTPDTTLVLDELERLQGRVSDLEWERLELIRENRELKQQQERRQPCRTP